MFCICLFFHSFFYAHVHSFNHLQQMNEGMMPFHSIVIQLQLGQTSALTECLVTALRCNRFSVPFSFLIPHSPNQFDQESVLVRPYSTCFSVFSASAVHVFSIIVFFFSFYPVSHVLVKEISNFILMNQFSSTLSWCHLGRGYPILGLQP